MIRNPFAVHLPRVRRLRPPDRRLAVLGLALAMFNPATWFAFGATAWWLGFGIAAVCVVAAASAVLLTVRADAAYESERELIDG